MNAPLPLRPRPRCRSLLSLGACLAVIAPAAMTAPGHGAAADAGTGEAIRGEIELAGVTGAAALPGDRLLLTTASSGPVLLSGTGERLRRPPVRVGPDDRLDSKLQGKTSVQDVQDAAADGAGSVYLAGSHARSRLGDAPEERYRLARLRFSPEGRLLEARQSDGLLKALAENVPFLADAMRRTPAKAGLHLGGLAWSPEGHLLIGLRSPTVTESAVRPDGSQEDAVVLRLTNPAALFASPPEPAELADAVKLDLHGQGIHGMCWDPERKGWWLVAGLSPEPNHPVNSPWALWFWTGSGSPRPLELPGIPLQQPAAVCRLTVDGRPALLLIDSGKTASRYALIPVPDNR